jgi:hypothetical protein
MAYKTDRLVIRDGDGDLRDKLKAIANKGLYGRNSSDVVRRLVDDLYRGLYNGREVDEVLKEQGDG